MQLQFRLLNDQTHFYILEVTKVVVTVWLTLYYPFETFILFVILDTLDGFSLTYRIRTLTLRHRIDKFTDFLCFIPFFFKALLLWPDLTLLFLIFFFLNILKTFIYITSGKRDILLYIPNLFLFLYISLLGCHYFYPEVFPFLLANPSYMIIFLAGLLIVSVIYELIYNGVLYRYRYRPRRRRREAWL